MRHYCEVKAKGWWRKQLKWRISYWGGELGAKSLKLKYHQWRKKKPGAVNRALCVFTLTCFFLWIRFLLSWAFLFGRLILFRFSCVFWHTIKFKISELFINGCKVFLPVFPCCHFRSGNCTARLKVIKDMPLGVNIIFECRIGCLWHKKVFLSFFMQPLLRSNVCQRERCILGSPTWVVKPNVRQEPRSSWEIEMLWRYFLIPCCSAR